MVDKIHNLFLSEKGKNIYESACSVIADENMFPLLHEGVLVGLSGGADSVMLLSFLIEYKKQKALSFPIAAVHVNHCIRGEEAERDEFFCKKLCEELEVELFVEKIDVPSLAKTSGKGLEEAAREARYSVFEDIIQGRNDISAIAVAHNRSDNAETVLFNILRGSGAKGASGIRPVRDNILRPLIRVAKADILAALDIAEISYVTDSTNQSSEYTRNYLRNEVIPALQRITPEPEKMLSRFADNMRSDDDFITLQAKDFLRGRKEIKNCELRALHYSLFVRVLGEMASFANAGISSQIASDIYKILDKDNFNYSLIGEASFSCERGICKITRNDDEKPDYLFKLENGTNSLSEFHSDFLLVKEKVEKTYLNIYKISIQANLSSAIISGSLHLRPKKDGDTVFYSGMTHKLKKLFSDRKIPPSKRALIPILCDDKGVVWVPGFGVRDDGVPPEKRRDLYAVIGILSTDTKNRFYVGTEYKT